MFASMKTATKIALGFALAALVTLIVGLTAWSGLGELTHDLDGFSQVLVPATRASGKWDEAQTAVARNINALFIPLNQGESRKGNWARLEESIARMAEGQKEFEALRLDAETRGIAKDIANSAATWIQMVRATAEVLRERERLAGAGDQAQLGRTDEQAWARHVESRKQVRVLDDHFDRLRERMDKLTKEAREDALATVSRSLTILVVAIGLGALLLVALAVLLSRSIGRVVRSMVAEAQKLTSAVVAGDLRVRADVSAVTAEFRPVVEGVNKTVEAFVKPIEVTQDYVVRMSQGDIPPKITDRYDGDFDKIKQALNQCIDAVNLLVADAGVLAKAGVEGRLQTRADASRHQGDFRKVVDGVNQTLDSVIGPINEAQAVLERIAQRDLTARIKGSYQGDFARIKESINSAGSGLHDALGQVAEAVEQVSSASTQIASSSQAVASGASEQASSLEETHSSLESMTAQTRQAADNASQAANLAGGAKTSAEEGAEAMDQMQGAMGKIRQSAEGTSAIIKDISEIAFQTNLLALNAAVEAARAGEAGRGFAVVAEEVRSLALRAKEAAVKTEELIKESVRQAGEGETASKLVAGKLGEIVTGIAKVSDIVNEIAASAKEQAAGIDQVNKAIGEMDKVTQQNAASSEESSSAAEELNSQAEELSSMVGSFRIERAPGAGRPAQARKMAAAPGKPRHANGKQANGKHANGIPLRPEEIIPMDGDPSFKEF
jgi:methyl-accepting chemotaxis protein